MILILKSAEAEMGFVMATVDTKPLASNVLMARCLIQRPLNDHLDVKLQNQPLLVVHYPCHEFVETMIYMLTFIVRA